MPTKGGAVKAVAVTLLCAACVYFLTASQLVRSGQALLEGRGLQLPGVFRLLKEQPWSATKAAVPASVAGLISAPAALHGWVRKGPPDLMQWHDDFIKERRAAFFKWSKERRRALAQKDPGEAAPVIIPACQVWLNHRYKFIYIRITKTGSTSLVKHLTECDSPSPGPACVERLPTETPRADVDRLFASYFVFTVVRNPYTRALSSYKFLLGKVRASPPSCTSELHWDSVCTDPMVLADRCRSNPDCCVQSLGFIHNHISRQGRCLGSTVPGAWAVDYMARTERMEGDMREILREIDRRRDPGAPPISLPEVGGGDSKGGRGGDDSEGGGSGGASQGARGGNIEGAGSGGSEGDSGRGRNGRGGSSGGGGSVALEDGGHHGSGSGDPGGLGRANVAPSCGEGGKRLEPFMAALGNLTYLAAVPEEQYCKTEQYYSGPHVHCLAAVQRYYRSDLELLYGGQAQASS